MSSPAACRQRCGQADLPHPAAGAPQRRQGQKPVLEDFEAARDRGGENAGPTKQEFLGRVLALETCQERDKRGRAISAAYSRLFPGSVHPPFPAVLGWR